MGKFQIRALANMAPMSFFDIPIGEKEMRRFETEGRYSCGSRDPFRKPISQN